MGKNTAVNTRQAENHSAVSTIVDLLDKTFALHASKTAIRLYDKMWTYHELRELTLDVSQYLQESGLKKGDRVALMMNRSIYLYAAMIGIMRAGGVVVPLDTKTPPARLTDLLAEISPLRVFTDRFSADLFRKCAELSPGRFQAVLLDDGEDSNFVELPFGSARPDDPQKADLLPNDLAMIYFTSGSTGEPKGVMIPHGSIFMNVQWVIDTLGYNVDDVTSGLNATAFSASTADIFPPLCSGGTLAVYPEEVIFPKDILDLTYTYKVTRTLLVTSTLNALVNSGLIKPEHLQGLKTVLLGGEPANRNVLATVMAMLPNAKFINGYGSTESSLMAVFSLNDYNGEDGGAVPIGFPIMGIRFTLDKTNFPENEERGELIVHSPHLSIGYWNDPDKTNKVFGKDEHGVPFYRTGDVASFIPGVGYCIHGRKDSQIKFLGYRINLQEIERVVSKVDSVTGNVVIPVRENGEIKSLKLVYEAAADCDEEIHHNLRKSLPRYMIPQHLVRLEQLPKNKSKKIDRALLFTTYGTSEN